MLVVNVCTETIGDEEMKPWSKQATRAIALSQEMERKLHKLETRRPMTMAATLGMILYIVGSLLIFVAILHYGWRM